jgi:hypothetical protein
MTWFYYVGKKWGLWEQLQFKKKEQAAQLA